MAKHVYIGQDSAAKKVTEIRVGINGISKNVKCAYIGVDGVAKQFWPRTLTHVWNRYRVNTVTTYSESIISTMSADLVDATLNRCGELPKSYSFNSSTGLYTLSNPSKPDDELDTVLTKSCKRVYYRPYYYFSEFEATPTGEYTEFYEVDYYQAGKRASATLHGRTESTSHVRGSFIDVVTSTSPGTYPTDGQYGSYWYVYQGVR